MKYSALKKHKNLHALLKREIERQQSVLNLIPSENYASPAVLEGLATIFSDKYAEGKSKQRYYFGNENVDTLESLTQELILKVFRITSRQWAINVQPYSGSIANLAVYAGLLKPGNTVLAMSLEHGGHLTHGHTVSFTSTVWNFVHYGVGNDGRIDYDEVARLAKKHKPKLIICGASAYPRIIDFKKFAGIAKSCGALLMADISHIAGLVVTGVHPSPFPYADVVTTTTHKTLRGPRAAVIIMKKELNDAIDKAIFPGLQGGPHMNTIFSLAVMAQEALQPGFKKYAQQIIKNAKVLEKELLRLGFEIISGGTDNHLLLIDVTPLHMSGKEAGEILERVGVIVNKNSIPNDSRKPWDPSGIRLGTPALTTRGMKEKEMKLVAQIIASVLKDRASVRDVHPYVKKLTKQFPIN
jgi:glycine hydroxymethyltransferase